MEIDQAEEAELVSATVADLVAALRAEEQDAKQAGSRVFTTSDILNG